MEAIGIKETIMNISNRVKRFFHMNYLDTVTVGDPEYHIPYMVISVDREDVIITKIEGDVLTILRNVSPRQWRNESFL